VSAAWVIARREWKSLWASLLPWSLLAVACALMGWWLMLGVDAYADAAPRFADRADAPGVTDLVIAPFLAQVAVLLMFLVPLVTMRAICEERRARTLPLLFAAGAGDAAIVLGKFAAILGYLAIVVALAGAMAVSLSVATSPDLGKIATGLIGLLLAAAALTAIGLAASAWAQHPAAAALAAFACGALLWMVDAGARARGELDGLVNWLALPGHLTAAMRGVLASVDVAYFLIVTALALALAVRRVLRLRELP
jgi:ABC-2 type transport system permease protein